MILLLNNIISDVDTITFKELVEQYNNVKNRHIIEEIYNRLIASKKVLEDYDDELDESMLILVNDKPIQLKDLKNSIDVTISYMVANDLDSKTPPKPEIINAAFKMIRGKIVWN